MFQQEDVKVSTSKNIDYQKVNSSDDTGHTKYALLTYGGREKNFLIVHETSLLGPNVDPGKPCQEGRQDRQGN